MPQKAISQGKNGTAEQAKYTYGLKDSKIYSKAQLNYDVKTLEDSKAETFKQEAFWMNLFTLGLTTTKMNKFAQDSLVSHEFGYLRDGYVQRIYGGIMPNGKPDYPEPGQPVTITASYNMQMKDAITGSEPGRLEGKHDIKTFQNADAFIDAKDYEDYKLNLSNVVSTSIAQAYNVAAKAFLLACGPAITLTDDVDISPFLDQSIRPDQNKYPSAHNGFDANGKFWKYVKKEIIGQTQAKFKNIGFYSPIGHNPLETGQEVKNEPAQKLQLKDNDTSYKDRYIRKDGATNKLHVNNNRFVSLLALTEHFNEVMIQVENIKSVMNIMDYDPTDPEAPTDLQLARTCSADQLCAIFNPFDYAEIQKGITNTSPTGNYTATIKQGVDKGLTVYTDDILLPGEFLIIEKGLFRIVQVLSKFYRERMDGALATQDGYHDFAIPIILSFGIAYKGIGLNVCPPQHYLTNKRFKALKKE